MTELSIGTFFRVDAQASRARLEAVAHLLRAHRTAKRCDPSAILRMPESSSSTSSTASCFARADLDAPLAMSDAMLARYAHRYLDSIMQHRAAAASDKVRELVPLWLSSGTAAPTAWRTIWASIEEPCIAIWRRPIRLSRRSSPRSGRTRDATTDRSRPISEIANLVGFSGQAAFSRWFTQQFGCSPSAWRESDAKRSAADAPLRKRRSASASR